MHKAHTAVKPFLHLLGSRLPQREQQRKSSSLKELFLQAPRLSSEARRVTEITQLLLRDL